MYPAVVAPNHEAPHAIGDKTDMVLVSTHDASDSDSKVEPANAQTENQDTDTDGPRNSENYKNRHTDGFILENDGSPGKSEKYRKDKVNTYTISNDAISVVGFANNASASDSEMDPANGQTDHQDTNIDGSQKSEKYENWHTEGCILENEANDRSPGKSEYRKDEVSTYTSSNDASSVVTNDIEDDSRSAEDITDVDLVSDYKHDCDSNDKQDAENEAKKCKYNKVTSQDVEMVPEDTKYCASERFVSPFPNFDWADSTKIWHDMLKRDAHFQRDPTLFNKHPELNPAIRATVLLWLSQVCEVYVLQRETFALAVDYLDRYLSAVSNVAKKDLQLVAISALYIAAKLEERAKPYMDLMVYATNMVYLDCEIVMTEIAILKAIKFELHPITTTAWLAAYLQLTNMAYIVDPKTSFLFPQFTTHSYVQMARVCNLCMLDVGCLRFSYSVIAASVLYHCANYWLIREISGLSWEEMKPCVKWMIPFAKAVMDVGEVPIKYFEDVKPEDTIFIHPHDVDQYILDRALFHQAAMEEEEKKSPSDIDLSPRLRELLTVPSMKMGSSGEPVNDRIPEGPFPEEHFLDEEPFPEEVDE